MGNSSSKNRLSTEAIQLRGDCFCVTLGVLPGGTNRNLKGTPMGFLIGFPLFIVAPCAIAVWLGTRVRSPLIAFVLTWIATPFVSAVITVVFTPVLRAIAPAGQDRTGAIMLPLFGIVTGLIAGIVSAWMVQRRRIKVAPKPEASD
jgi:hypothetical protein